jgi:hypothetical protein
MKKLVLMLSIVMTATVASSVIAQQPSYPLTKNAPPKLDAKPELRVDVSPGELTPTTEMWFYEQEWKRHDDPKQAVRRNAEYDTAQRQLRMSARKWYGFSNLRPAADGMPFCGDYSPAWRSNTFFPYQWAGTTGGTTVVVVRPDYELIRY